MTLALTEEHLALAESVRGWAGHAAPAPVIRSAVDAEDHGAALYRDTLRPGLAAQGLLGLHLPEALGGQGAGLPELAVAAEEEPGAEDRAAGGAGRVRGEAGDDHAPRPEGQRGGRWIRGWTASGRTRESSCRGGERGFGADGDGRQADG
jgi:alkylation response protein AidB-like acyl-CoA dehydrogenase